MTGIEGSRSLCGALPGHVCSEEKNKWMSECMCVWELFDSCTACHWTEASRARVSKYRAFDVCCCHTINPLSNTDVRKNVSTNLVTIASERTNQGLLDS